MSKFVNGEEIEYCYQCEYWDYGVDTPRRSQHVCKKSNKYFPKSYKGKEFDKSWNEKIPDWCEL